MVHDFKTGPLLARYLLGEASPEECSDLEAKYLANTDLFEELVAAENDLIDAYTRGQLADTDRKRFEEHFLVTPERRQRVEFARTLLSHMAAETGGIEKGKTEFAGLSPVAAMNRWSAAARLIMLIFFAAVVAWSAWVTMQNFHLRRKIAKLQTEIASLQGKEAALQQQIVEFQAKNLSNQGNRQDQEKANSPIAVLTLNAAIPRASGLANSIDIFPGTRFVRLQLVVEDRGYSILNATVETVNGTRVWQKKDLPVHTRRETRADLTVPAKVLDRGDYIINLTAVGPNGKTEAVNSYAFQVARR